ncbi:hypothetical protein LSCM1_03519 [Leishmania martiniquensis]|uniref:Uncharacterized protein n=1 Tax=Leishmania martiniquensis TaxID=1580590 RepID=A0A836HCV4_9TRYP|nr:hypothetical protein LSCM1_03519 [Leishmania martiniquensis]
MPRRLRRRHLSGTMVWRGATILWALFDGIGCLTLLSASGTTFYTGPKKDVEVFLQEDLSILPVPGEDVVDMITLTELGTAAVTPETFSFHSSRYHRHLQHDLQAHCVLMVANAFANSPKTPRVATCAFSGSCWRMRCAATCKVGGGRSCRG